jgi:uncharacterized membrane protein YoaK (UPF0700 family)
MFLLGAIVGTAVGAQVGGAVQLVFMQVMCLAFFSVLAQPYFVERMQYPVPSLNAKDPHAILELHS